MAATFASNKKYMMAEGLFRESIESMSKRPILPYYPLSLAKAKTAYAHMLNELPKRENEGQRILQEAHEIKEEMKEFYWYDKIDMLILP